MTRDSRNPSRSREPSISASNSRRNSTDYGSRDRSADRDKSRSRSADRNRSRERSADKNRSPDGLYDDERSADGSNQRSSNFRRTDSNISLNTDRTDSRQVNINNHLHKVHDSFSKGLTW